MGHIVLRGVRTNNLKNVDADIPRNQLVVITGPSGSGKSSLAFDTIYAEGQRRYVESLSANARQFLSQMPKPDIDMIDGLSPTIAISQAQTTRNPRSTVGTATELYDYFRLLFARCGAPHCPGCGTLINPLTVQQMVDHTCDTLPEGTRFSVLSPVIRNKTGNLSKLLLRLRKDGFVRVSIDDELRDLGDTIKLSPDVPHSLDIYVDRLVMGPDIKNRLADSLELALREAGGLAIISPIGADDISFTDSHSCAKCNITMERLDPSDFSFNTPAGACPTCNGLGMKLFFEESKIIANPHVCLREGAITPWSRRNAPYYQQLLDAVTSRYGIDPFTPWHKLPKKQQQLLLYGTGEELEFTVSKDKSKLSFKKKFEGVIPNLERRSQEYDKRKRDQSNADEGDYLSDEFTRYMGTTPCDACHGARLKSEALHVTIQANNIAELSAMTITQLTHFFTQLKLPTREAMIAAPILKEINSRLSFLNKVGLDYLTLNRPVFTLSGGESQRIRLANQLGSSLVGVTYVLDEPSIGLHQRDNDRLLDTLRHLKEQGNSVIVVEHDCDTINAADHIIDMGPGAGVTGGKIIAQGTPREIKADPHSVTGAYLNGTRKIDVPRKLRPGTSRQVTLEKVSTNNLKDVTIRIPLGVFVAVSGVSGSGKSSLIMDTLLPAAREKLHKIPSKTPLCLKQIKGLHGNVNKVISVDQSPIGRTPRSNPATYTQVFGDIRDVFAATSSAKQRGYAPGRFSFNIKGGRCEACQGDGLIRIEMNFLPDTYITCEVCGGKRYNRETLEVEHRGHNIASVLDMTCNQAYDFFENHPKIRQKLTTIRQVGLGYLKLGQNAATLSGGEAQRLKLAKELARKTTGRALYIMDEPTTGLHFKDIEQLLEVLKKLVDAGNSLVIIEHNLDIIKNADWIIDMGPEGGDKGGTVAAVGTAKDIAKTTTHTGRYLKKVL